MVAEVGGDGGYLFPQRTDEEQPLPEQNAPLQTGCEYFRGPGQGRERVADDGGLTVQMSFSSMCVGRVAQCCEGDHV